MNISLIKNKLFDNGFIIFDFLTLLDTEEITQVKNEVLQKKWSELDQRISIWNKKEGVLFQFLLQFLNFNSMEHIIAIRQGPDDEDGIWHDDGSRVLAYSLSLNLNPKEISGGQLFFRKKNVEPFDAIPPLPFGQIIVFLTGTSGYEHKVCAVTKGERIISAGWCE